MSDDPESLINDSPSITILETREAGKRRAEQAAREAEEEERRQARETLGQDEDYEAGGWIDESIKSKSAGRV